MRTLAELIAAAKADPGSLTRVEAEYLRREIARRKAGSGETGAYQRHREQARDNRARVTRAGQDIGPIPAAVNLERKARASGSLLEFKKTYFSHKYFLGFSQDHLSVNARQEEAIQQGGLFALAMPRGSGKTTDAEIACLFAALTGQHSFVLFLGNTKDAALQSLDAIKSELLENTLLAEDFPEVCFPIAALEDRANRCKGQHSQGKKTNILWGADRIQLPTVEGSRASAAYVRVAGITASFRGLKKGARRPSLVILDDPQTDASARNPLQVEKRTRIINGAVLGLAGPGQKITCLLLCTVIQKGDLADNFLDREKAPLWTGQRYKLLYQFPTRMDLWDQYSVLRNDEIRNGGDGSQATAFYADNRAAMDEGAVVAWTERKKKDELSAIQGAMNFFFADRKAFFAEFQNEPEDEDLGDEQLDVRILGGKLNGLRRATLPLHSTHLTGFIDVQKRVLFWLVAAWREDFTGAVVDYGTWPDQQRSYFTAADVQRTLGRACPGAGVEGQITHGLGRCAEDLFGRTWAREDGAPLKIGRLLVDAGYEGDTVKTWCRSTHHAALVMASHGHGLTAASKPWAEYDRSRCERLGTHWMIPKATRGNRHVSIDTNWWKSFVCRRLMQALGDKGSLALFGKPGHDHRMLCDHLTSEYWVETEGRGRQVHEWRLRPDKSENHWWDCLVGAAVAASMLGCHLLEEVGPMSNKSKSLGQMYAEAHPEKRGQGSGVRKVRRRLRRRKRKSRRRRRR